MDTYSQFRKCMAIGIMMLLIGVTSIFSVSAENVQDESATKTNIIIVDNEGDGDYTSIHDAIENASYDDIIEVYSGIYHENVFINKTLTLVGIDAEFGTGNDTGNPVLDGNGSNTTGVTITADGTLIRGFLIREYYDYLGMGIYVQSNYTTVSENQITNCYWGILIGGNHNSIAKNEIHNDEIRSTTNLLKIGCNDSKIYQNNLSGGMFGIDSSGSQNTELNNNILSSNHIAMRLSWFTHNITIQNNIIKSNDEGIAITYFSYDILIDNNTIVLPETKGDAISLDASDYITISHNQVIGKNTSGMISMHGSNYNKIISNDFKTFLLVKLFNSLHNFWIDNYYYWHWLHGLPRIFPGVLAGPLPFPPWAFVTPYFDFELFPARHPHVP